MEVFLVGLGLCGLLFALEVIRVTTDTAATTFDKDDAPVLQLRVISNAHQLWIRRGLFEIFLLDLSTRKLQSVRQCDRDLIVRSSVSDDARTYMLAVGAHDFFIHRDREIVVSQQYFDDSTIGTAVSADGTTAVHVCCRDVRWWDLSSQEPVTSSFQLTEPGDRIALSTHGDKLVVATQAGNLQLYNLRTGTLERCLAEHLTLSSDPLFTQDGDWLVVPRDNELDLFDLLSSECLWSLTSPSPHGVRNIAVSNDGQWIATSGITDEVYIIERATGRFVQTIPAGHGSHHMAFSPDGDLLYCSCRGGSILVWSLTTGKELERIQLNTATRDAVD